MGEMVGEMVGEMMGEKGGKKRHGCVYVAGGGCLLTLVVGLVFLFFGVRFAVDLAEEFKEVGVQVRQVSKMSKDVALHIKNKDWSKARALLDKKLRDSVDFEQLIGKDVQILSASVPLIYGFEVLDAERVEHFRDLAKLHRWRVVLQYLPEGQLNDGASVPQLTLQIASEVKAEHQALRFEITNITWSNVKASASGAPAAKPVTEFTHHIAQKSYTSAYLSTSARFKRQYSEADFLTFLDKHKTVFSSQSIHIVRLEHVDSRHARVVAKHTPAEGKSRLVSYSMVHELNMLWMVDSLPILVTGAKLNTQ